MTYDIFVFYADDDELWVNDFLLGPLKEAGINCATEDDFTYGVPRLQEFERVIKASRRTLLVLSPAYLSENFAEYTESLVQYYGIESGEWKIIPLILEPVDLPGRLKQLVSLDAREPEHWAEMLERLFAQLGSEVPTINAPAPGDPPYMGLQYFDVKDSPWFYGRSGVTKKLLHHLSSRNFLAVVGASGSGKSSVVRAGLISTIQSDRESMVEMAIPKGSQDWPIHIINPGASPLSSLAASLTKDSQSTTAKATLTDEFTKDPHGLDSFVQAMYPDFAANGNGLLIVVDQFEELFTLCRDAAEREVFINNLLAAAQPQQPVRVVITLRADFYHHCLSYRNLREALENNQINLGQITQQGLRMAIEEPAKKGGWSFAPGLVDQLLRDVGAQGDGQPEPGALPLLSHALLETWKRRRGTQMTFASYHEAGTVQGAIAKTADRVYAGLDENDKKIARSIFLRLTEVSEDTQDTRRRAGMDELVLEESKRPQIEFVLKTLADARLIMTDGDSVEVAHEALIREWGLLRSWLEEDREALRIHRHLARTAESWEKRNRDPSELYRGSRLSQAEEWAEKHSGEMSQQEREFLSASEAKIAQEKRSLRLRWISLFGVLALAFVIAVFAATGRLNRFIYRPIDMDTYWIPIPAGEFLMGSSEADSNAASSEFPQHEVFLDGFQIGRYEITNNQWEQCERAGLCSPKYAGLNKKDHPVVNLNWIEAQTFCAWVGGRLPTEAEWEKAARGTDGRRYPWGDTEPNRDLANYNGYAGSTTPVGFYPDGASPYGLFDMAGNAWEWVGDWYAADYYASGLSRVANPEGPLEGETRVLKGGNKDLGASGIRAADRAYSEPTNTYNLFGFRCVRVP